MNRIFDALIRASIRYRKLVTFVALILVVASLVSLRGARLDALPSFTPPTVVVQAEAPGFGSGAVERRITTPIEQALLGLPDLTRVRSTSAPGLAVVELTFTDDVDLLRARSLVGERLALARARLPADLPPPRLAPITAPVGALVKFCYSPAGPDREQLANVWRFAEWTVRPRLEAIEGVSRVTIHGAAAARIEVRPDPTRLLAHEVDLATLRSALLGGQSLAALGYTEVGSQSEPIRMDGTWSIDDLSSIADTVVVTNAAGLPVRVRDVAEVVLGEAPAVGAALYDGQPAIYIQIDKLPWADTLTVSEAVEARLAELDVELPPGARRQPPVYRQADFVRTSVSALGRAMAFGGILVLVVLVAFLRSPRLAVISAVALPVSLLTAAACFATLDIAFDGMLLGGLAIAVGEFVDDAIVDVENIARRLRDNATLAAPRPALEVIHDASAEVRGAVVYASAIVVATLIPVMTLGGVTGRIFSPLAHSYALGIAASLVVALTLTPALCAWLLPRMRRSTLDETLLARQLGRAYAWALTRVQWRPRLVVVAALATGGLALASLPLLGGAYLPEFREGMVIAEVVAWPGTSLEETTRLAASLDEQLRRDVGLPHVAVRVGRASLDEDAAPVYRMEIDAVLPTDVDDSEAVVDDIAARVAELPGASSSVEGFLGERIDELLGGERAPIVIELRGDDLTGLREAATELLAAVTELPGVESVQAKALAEVPTTDLRLDADRLALAGVRRGEVVDAVATWRFGLAVGDAQAPGGYTVPIVIAGDRERGDHLADLPVFVGPGTVLPLESLVEFEQAWEPALIQHVDGERVVRVSVSVRPELLSTTADRITRLLDESIELPAGARWSLAGQAAERERANARLALVVAMVVLAALGFLWLAFDSLLDAVFVLGCLPFGLLGGVLAALVLPEGLSMASLVGFVTLAGIVCRNAILLVIHERRSLDERVHGGQAPAVVILRAASERLVPIVMTAATAFFGLLPLALAFGQAGSELESPMAVIVCAGLVTSTIANLFVVPAFFFWRHRESDLRSES